MKFDSIFLKFAIAVMNRLKYPQKFGLISIVFILPISLLMYLLFSELQNRVEFSKKELAGNVYLRPLQQLSLQIYRLQFLDNDIREKSSLEIANLQLQADTTLQSLEVVDRKLGETLVTQELFNELIQSWKKLQQNQRTWSKETRIYYYQKMLDQIVELRRQVGNQSNLILDPDLDTYYMMDATLLKIPKIQETLSEIQSVNQTIAKYQNITPTDVHQLTVLLGKLKSYNNELKRNMRVAFNNNPSGNLQVKINDQFDLFNQDIDQMFYFLDKSLLSTNKIQVEKIEFQANQIIKNSDILWNICINELEWLLQNRVDGLIGKQMFATGFVILILTLVIYLFMGFYIGVMETVSGLSAASKRMISGNLTEKVTLNSRDELADVVHSFNDIAAALIEANQEITLLNSRLQAENLRMSAELEVTHRLQQMILPKEDELEKVLELDIAGFMQPAAEVGGDYYDVLQQDGKIKIGIGDVTGHGLESGVVMIMAQTAVRALLANGETDPVRLLNTVNQIIYENTRRMKSHKNMTMMLLEYEAGVLRLSGQHEDLIIVRADGRVEPIDTFELGFPLGIESDISHFVSETEVKLQPGDIAVLYTDGITEAMSASHEQYGPERMYEVIRQNRHNCANEIRLAIILDLRQHIGEATVFDDITLVVLKQN